MFSLYSYKVFNPIDDPNVVLQLWGGFNKCELDSMLWQSPILDTTWHQYIVQFIPNKSYSYLTFIVKNLNNGYSYIGVDALSDITVDGVAFPQSGSITVSRDTVCTSTPVTLSVAGNTDSVQWQSSVTADSYTDISNAKDVTCTAAPAQTTYYRAYTRTGSCDDTTAAYKIVVAAAPVAAFSFIKDSLQISFNSDSSRDAISYEWDFGDNTAKSTEKNPVHTYAKDTVYKVCLTVTNGSNCSFTVCHNTNEVDGIEKSKVKSQKIKVYPNPVTDKLIIDKLRIADCQIEVKNVLGQTMLEKGVTANERQVELDVRGLAQGVYFVEVKAINGYAIEKFVKE